MIVEQLRQAREAKGITLAALQDKVGVRQAVLSAIERGAFDQLPAGLYGRHAVRAYATAVGIDADAVLAEVGELLPRPEDPLDGLARVRGYARRARLTVAPEERTQSAPAVQELEAEHVQSALDWRPFAASAIDGAVLVGVVLALAQLTAVTAGTPLLDMIAVAFPAWTFMALLISGIYFVLLGGVRNATLGAAAVGAATIDSKMEAVDARSAIRRGLHCALRESSMIVEWLIGNVRGHGWLLSPRS
jgi:transcriptional regulator with XRE-family HTH domain